MKSTPPASFTPDDSGPRRRAHARFLAALLSAAALALALWLVASTGDAVPAATQAQLLVALGTLVLLLTGITFYLAAASISGRRNVDSAGVDASARVIRSIRVLSAFGAVFAVVAVLGVAGLGALRVFAPPADRPVSVQFSEITGRVQLEFCPSLPSAFEALATPADLAGSSTLLPIWVASRVCGNPSFQNGVWLYLNRSTITVADAGDR
ncbi:hypothetical protein [Cryobacterium sp. PH31-O1]|uniref:hypothetical protein n=1 Tax=Cryobacterium sp. PH31-O1 TaxID=3046306 RepID=UPI0024B90E7D|nr:hypothetical protein [Cryobacterium sp. PH31-O1]MDJ0338801.1 hypothetical protein [Cryobacterium sp. PH31-O1]